MENVMIDEEVWIVKKIGVEQSLTNIQAALREKGYEVVSLQTESDAQNVDCCVVTGLDSNVMGIQNTTTSASIIEANGLSADDVINEIEHKMS